MVTVEGETPAAATLTLKVLALSSKLTKSLAKNLVDPPPEGVQLTVPPLGDPVSQVGPLLPFQVITSGPPVTTTSMALSTLFCWRVKVALDPLGGIRCNLETSPVNEL